MSKPNHMPWLSPYIMCTNVDKALDFYETAFKFEPTEEKVPGEDGSTWHAAMRYRDQVLMFGKTGGHSQTPAPIKSGHDSPIGLYLYVDDVDQFCEYAKANGAKVLEEPNDTFWGDRMCRLQDPEGYSWSFASLIS